MKKINSLIACVLIVAAFVGGQCVERSYWKPESQAMAKKIQEYRSYYVTVEHLLDLQGVDRTIHDGYHESKVCVLYLDSIGIEHEKAHYEIILENNKRFE